MKTVASIVALLLVCVMLSAQTPQRAIVIEDHTGAWCGWCPRGIQAAEDLHAEYGNRIIPLCFHNGDSMTLAIQDTLAKKFKITGYPSGLIDRESFTFGNVNSNILDPDNWTDAVTSLKSATSNMAVSIEWSIDANSILHATVHATAQINLSTQYAFNLVVVEDSVTGSGTGWDQTNYLSDRRGYESYPFYYQPGHIAGFYHMNVVRAYVGGVDGTVGSMPATPKKGESYSASFDVDLKTIPIQHREHLWVAGLVVEHASPNRIVNAVSDGKRPTPKSTYWKVNVQSTDNYRHATRGDSTVYDVLITNPNAKDVTAIPTVDETNSLLPSDWDARFEPATIDVKSGQSAHVKLIVKLGKAVGYGGIKVVTQIKPFDDIRSLPASTQVGVLSDNVQFAIAKFDLDEGADLDPLLKSYNKLASYPAATAVINCNDSTLSHYDFSSFDVLILPESYATRTSIIFDKKLVAMMKDRAEHARPMLITSPMDMWFTADNYGSIVSADVKQFFNETLGFTGARRSWGPWLWNSSIGKSAVVGVRSFADQSVAPAMDFNVNETDDSYTIQDAWLDELSILDSNRVHRILNFYGDKISDDSSVAAVWTQLHNTAAIYQGFGFEAIKDEPVRRTLLANYLGFLMKSTDVSDDQFNAINPAHIQLTPNPVAEQLHYSCSVQHSGAVLRVCDVSGRQVLERKCVASGQDEGYINIKDIAPGTYYLLLEDGASMSTQAFVVQR